MKIAVEQISKYHPDKYADAISDEILKDILAKDPDSQCGIETMVKDDYVVIGGEVSANFDIDEVVEIAVKKVADELKYNVAKIINLLGKQSPQINKAVLGDDIGAGDQGIVVGYANIAEIRPYIRTPYIAKLIADDIIRALETETETNAHGFELKGDAKCQVIYDTELEKVTEVVVSVCHRAIDFNELKKFVELYVVDNPKITINPAGEWTIGGPTADCGLTGRKLVCDAYGPQVQIGGGCQSGKNLTKVDRSGAIVARYIALQFLKTYSFQDVRVEISYIIGQSKPSSVAVFVEGRPSKRLSKVVEETYDLTPSGLIRFIKEKNINIYQKVGQMK